LGLPIKGDMNVSVEARRESFLGVAQRCASGEEASLGRRRLQLIP